MLFCRTSYLMFRVVSHIANPSKKKTRLHIDLQKISYICFIKVRAQTVRFSAEAQTGLAVFA